MYTQTMTDTQIHMVFFMIIDRVAHLHDVRVKKIREYRIVRRMDFTGCAITTFICTHLSILRCGSRINS